MATRKDIHEFAIHWAEKYRNPYTKQCEVEAGFGDECFSLGFVMDWNLTEELTVRINRLIEISNKKVDNYRYKRIYFKSIKLSQDDYEQSLRNATKTLIKNALEEEKKLIATARSLS